MQSKDELNQNEGVKIVGIPLPTEQNPLHYSAVNAPQHLVYTSFLSSSDRHQAGGTAESESMFVSILWHILRSDFVIWIVC